MSNIKILIFDADDTLWENNKFFIHASDAFFDLCANSGFNRDLVIKSFYDFELKVVTERGYGSENYIYILNYLFDYFGKSKKLNKKKFDSIINKFNSHLINDPPLFKGVEETLDVLEKKFQLYVLTKGNIEEQNEKVERSGLKKYFDDVYIVSEKNDKTYQSILKMNKWLPGECCMIGNSPKSDINPALRHGMYAIYIPYAYTWKLDDENLLTSNQNRLFEITKFTDIPNTLSNLLKS